MHERKHVRHTKCNSIQVPMSRNSVGECLFTLCMKMYIRERERENCVAKQTHAWIYGRDILNMNEREAVRKRLREKYMYL